jgi:hypothetical protein
VRIRRRATSMISTTTSTSRSSTCVGIVRRLPKRLDVLLGEVVHGSARSRAHAGSPGERSASTRAAGQPPRPLQQQLHDPAIYLSAPALLLSLWRLGDEADGRSRARRRAVIQARSALAAERAPGR